MGYLKAVIDMQITDSSTSELLPEIGTESSHCRYEHIREVALALFVREGFSKVSLRQLSKQIGVHPGSLYNHLRSKEELLFELISDYQEDLLAAVLERVAGQPDAPTRLTAFIEAHVNSHVNERELSLLTSLEIRSLTPQHRSTVNLLLKSQRDCLKTIIQDGMQNGQFRQQPLPIAVHGILSMLSGIAFWYDAKHDFSENQIKNHFCAMALSTLQKI